MNLVYFDLDFVSVYYIILCGYTKHVFDPQKIVRK